MTRTCVAQDSSSSLARAVHISHHLIRLLHALMLCVWFSGTLPSSSCCLSSLLSSCSSSWLSASSSTMWWTNTLRTSANEDLGTVAEYDPLTCYEPKQYHISETTEPYIQESSGENGPLNWHDLEYDDYTIGMALSLHQCSPRSEPRDSLQQGHPLPWHQCQIYLPSWHKTGFACSSHGREQGWVMQGVLSRASFRRSPVSGQVTFTVLSLHISNIYAKQKGIAKKLILTVRAIMISQEVDLVAGDFNGTAWRSRSRDNLSTIDEAFADCALPTPPGPHHCGDLDPFRTIGPTSVDFSSHPALNDSGRSISMVLSPSLGKHLAWDRMIKAAIMTWLHLHFFDWNNKWSNQAYYNMNIRLKERPADSSYGTQKRHISEVMSEHSLSSWTRNHLRIPGSCDFTFSSSQSDLMSSDVSARLLQVRRVSVSSTLVFPVCHFPSRTPGASCPPWKKDAASQESGILLWRTFLLPFPASIIPGSSLWLRTLNCLTFSADSCEVFPTTAPRMWTEHPHTSHFLVFHSTHTPMSHASCAVVVLILLDSPFCTLHRLSHLPSHSPDLHLPCRLVRVEQIPCAPPRMRR